MRSMIIAVARICRASAGKPAPANGSAPEGLIRYKPAWLTAALLFSGFTATQAHAVPITFDFTADLDNVGAVGVDGDPNAFFGETLNGSYTFESTTTDSRTVGLYLDALSHFSFTTTRRLSETIENTTAVTMTNGGIRVRDDSGDADTYLVRGDSTTATGTTLILGVPFSGAGITLSDSSATALSSYALPTSPPTPLSQWDSHNELTISYRNRETRERLAASYTLTSLTQTTSVPAPATVLLFCVGLAGLSLGVRNRRPARHLAEIVP